MTRKFNVGDRVRIIRSCVPSRVGIVTTVTGSPVTGVSGKLCYPLDLANQIDPSDGRMTNNGVRGDWLEPVYDGNEKTSWSSCAWQPKRVST